MCVKPLTQLWDNLFIFLHLILSFDEVHTPSIIICCRVRDFRRIIKSAIALQLIFAAKITGNQTH